MTPTEILDAAVRVILHDGWLQGDTDNGNVRQGPVCLMGALARAATGSSRTDDVTVSMDGPMPEANEAVRRVVGVIGRADVGNWNDEPERTAGDVLDALRRAAA